MGSKTASAKFHIERITNSDGSFTDIVVYDFDENGNHIVVVVDDRTLDEAKSEALFNVINSYNVAWESPVAYMGDFIQVDADSREDLLAYKAVASDAISGLVKWPTDTEWRMLSNNMLSLPTPQDMINLAMAPLIRNTQLFKRSLAAKSAVAAATTNEEADGVIF